MVQKTQEPQNTPALVADLTPSESREISCRITNSIIKYVESQGYQTEALFEGLPYTRQYMTDPFNWVSYAARETLCQRAALLMQDDAFMYQVGLISPKKNSYGGLEHLVRVLGDPKMTYRIAPRYGALFDLVVKFRTTIVGDNKATFNMSLPEGYATSKHACHFARGTLAAIPTLWGLPPAEVVETHCMCEPGEGNQHGERVCSYEVTWQPLPPPSKRLWDLITKRNDAATSLKKLEENFVTLDRKNAELTAKNRQLAKIREIALAVDGISTRDQVYRTVVELARDISGVRLVLFLKEDETGKYIVCPYHSRIRQKNLLAPLKKLGYDLESVLGSEPDSNKLKFLASDSKMTPVYRNTHKVIVETSLAAFLDGVRPKLLCDAIQRIVGIKNVTIVPVTVAGESWGTMVFILDSEVDPDVLEMVGAHCSSALKNAQAMEKLENSNAELRQSEEKIRILYEKEKAARVELEEEAKARGMFIDVLAHELRTPLTPLLASADLLGEIMRADPPSTRTKLVNNIRNSTQTMVQRLEELLELARYSRGTFKLNIQPVELVTFLSRVVASFEPSLLKDRIHLTTLLPETETLVGLDASRMEQVLTNLLSNASKYSQPSGRIQFQATLDNSTLRVDVSDEGRGIPLEAQQDLFRPYHRVEQDRKIPGLGLGLAVCKQIVEAHGGTIWVESTVGKGSTFSFSIPVKVHQDVSVKSST